MEPFGAWGGRRVMDVSNKERAVGEEHGFQVDDGLDTQKIRSMMGSLVDQRLDRRKVLARSTDCCKI